MLNTLMLLLACWSHLPLDQHVKGRVLIIQATLVSVDRAPPASVVDNVTSWLSGRAPNRIDRGVLKISAVLKAPDATVAAPGTVPLLMPAIDQEQGRSTDFTFQPGASGIWLLIPTPGGWTAMRPDDLQPITQLDAIRTHIAEQAR